LNLSVTTLPRYPTPVRPSNMHGAIPAVHAAGKDDDTGWIRCIRLVTDQKMARRNLTMKMFDRDIREEVHDTSFSDPELPVWLAMPRREPCNQNIGADAWVDVGVKGGPWIVWEGAGLTGNIFV